MVLPIANCAQLAHCKLERSSPPITALYVEVHATYLLDTGYISAYLH